MAPTVLRDGQFRLFFFSREEPRIHVHVSHPDGETKFWLTPHIHLAISVGLNQRQIREAQSVVDPHRSNYKCLAQSFRYLRLPTFQNMGSGCCLLTKNCYFRLSNSPGFAVPPLSSYPMSSGRRRSISTGQRWILTFLLSQSDGRRPSPWFQGAAINRAWPFFPPQVTA